MSGVREKVSADFINEAEIMAAVEQGKQEATDRHRILEILEKGEPAGD